MKNTNFFIVLVTFLCYSNIAFCQSTIGITGGINRSNFYTPFPFIKDEYTISKKYTAYNQYNFSAFLKGQINKKVSHVVALEFNAAKSHMDILTNTSHSTSYRNVTYSLKYLNAYYYFNFALASGKDIRLSFDIGPYLGYLLNLKAEGEGWDPVIITHNGYTSIGSEPWVKEDASKDIDKFNAGIRLGWDIEAVLYKNTYLIIDNSYCFGMVSNNPGSGYSCLRDIKMNIGLAYKFKRKHNELNSVFLVK